MKVTVEHLTKHFGTTVAVNNLSVTFGGGKLFALLGPSGCGKTTILNMLSGILPVTTGTIYFDDRDVTALPPEKRNIGLVFQNYALYPHMTVLENICFPLEIKRIPKAERIQRAKALAELVRIQDLLDRKPSQLSGGQQQRVAIARALVKEPQLLLLDEPLSNLDAKLRVEMREEILRIQRASRITTIFVTHDQEEASSIADEVILLRSGVLQQMGPPRILYDQPSNFFAADFLGAPPINKLRGTVRDGVFYWEDSSLCWRLPLRQEVVDGTRAILAIRAESVIYPAEGATLRAKVLERYSINKDELSVLELGAQRIRGFISGEYDLPLGGEIDISLRSRGVFLFDEATGERLA